MTTLEEHVRAGKRRRTRGRFAEINAFVDRTLSSLGRNDIAVWLVLWRDTKRGTASTGYTDIARRAGCSVRTVGRVIGRLRRRGLIRRLRQGGSTRGTAVYEVNP